MNTLKKIILFTLIVGMVSSCSKIGENSDQESYDLKCGDVNTHTNQHFWPGSKTVTLPFEANFIGNYMETSGIDEEMCGAYPNIRIFNEGGGTGTHLGKFTHYFDFCCNNETGEYPEGHMVAYFVAADGDTLFVACAGQVFEGRAEDHPEYVNSYFRDPFVILGGTGRFYGATGNGMTDDFNSDLDPNSHHHWKGTITLQKGRYSHNYRHHGYPHR